jgi:hypothetical protein
MCLAAAYAALADNDKAFGWLEHDFAARSPELISLKMAENLGALRNDQRFRNLLKRIGLP